MKKSELTPKDAQHDLPDHLRVRQAANRASYDQQAVYDVLDACLVGHISFIHNQMPFSIPTAIARIGDSIYLHGSRTSRMFKHLASGSPLCLSVCVVDGLVKAKSAFHCSLNYRSAVVFGQATPVNGDDKSELLYQITERLIPLGREHYREHLAKEIKATELLRVVVSEASVKTRDGGPNDDEEDRDLPLWAGQVPLAQVSGTPIDSPDLHVNIEPPNEVRHGAGRDN